MSEEKELAVFRILQDNEEITQKDFITEICKALSCGRSKAYLIINSLTLPIVSNKDDKTVFPGLINNKNFAMNPRYTRIYKLNDDYKQYTEKEFISFVNTHINVNYELRVSK